MVRPIKYACWHSTEGQYVDFGPNRPWFKSRMIVGAFVTWAINTQGQLLL